MQIEIVTQEKNEVELRMDNITVAEVLRVYLNEAGADFAAWRREHPDKPIVMKIQGKDVKKDVSTAVKAIKKDLEEFVKSVKK